MVIFKSFVKLPEDNGKWIPGAGEKQTWLPGICWNHLNMSNIIYTYIIYYIMIVIYIYIYISHQYLGDVTMRRFTSPSPAFRSSRRSWVLTTSMPTTKGPQTFRCMAAADSWQNGDTWPRSRDRHGQHPTCEELTMVVWGSRGSCSEVA